MPFFINNARRPRVLALLAVERPVNDCASSLGVKGTPSCPKSTQDDRQAAPGAASKSVGRPAQVDLVFEGFENQGPVASVSPVTPSSVTNLVLNGVRTRAAA